MFCVTVLLSTFVTAWLATCSDGCQCGDVSLPDVKPEYSDRILALSSYVRLNTGSLGRCGVRCMRQRKCKSFNYDADSGTCSLSVSSHYTMPANMFIRPTHAWVYYTVGQWDQSIVGGCSNHVCADEEVCEVLGGTTLTRSICRTNYSADLVCGRTTCAECQPVREHGQRTFSAKGCYPSLLTNTLPNLLGNFRDSTIVWNDLSSFEEVLQKCAAVSGQYELFGVEYFGECYAGNHADVTLPGEVDVNECSSKCLYDDVGIGHADVMFVYQWN